VKPLDEAQREVLAAMNPLPIAAVPLADAGGLVLARPVEAPHDLPPFANTGMDGYAVRSADTGAAPSTLRVIADIPAGMVPDVSVEPGTAARIMTGAPMPDGADAVAEVEITEPGPGGTVTVREAVEPGRSVRPAGGDVAAGARIFDAGERLGPHHLGLLAAVGASEVMVRRRPRVAVLSTGDEVREPQVEQLEPGTIRDANRPMLVAMLGDLGAHVIDLGIVPDHEPALRAALAEAAAEADVVVSSGGVSMGERDLMKAVLADLGTVEVWRVAMQPAKPFAFGMVEGTPVFGLPGNPVSVTVAFEQFVRPALLRMMGARRLFRPRIPAVLAEPASTNPDKAVFLRVAVALESGAVVVRPSGGQASNVLSALAAADGFALVPVGTADLPAGAGVEVEMFRSPESRTFEEALG
jgi:molybdopterin molybdotransferase